MIEQAASSFILDRIPHRPPFLWLDEVVELTTDRIHARKHLAEDLDLFQGHYPQYPLMPGVLLCEAVFQAGALLIGELLVSDTADSDQTLTGVPVLTRIYGAKFKREVRPGETLDIMATLQERMGMAWLMKGEVRVDGKRAVQVEFACALKEE